MHNLYCLKNITKCPHCRVIVDSKELEQHIGEKKGNSESLLKTIEAGDLETLKIMTEHEFNLQDFENEEDNLNTALHYATKADKI